jgi:hypothetical protein
MCALTLSCEPSPITHEGDLKSVYKGEHMIFGLLSLADLAQNDVLQFHPFTCA